MVASVFKHDDIAVFHCSNLSISICAVIDENNIFTDEFAEVISDKFHGVVGVDAFFIGTSHVAHEDKFAAFFEDVFD